MAIRSYLITSVPSQLLWALSLIFLANQSALANSGFDVTINTSSLDTTGATLAFDLIAGGGTQSNSVSISDFSTDGVLGSSGPNSGSVSGSLPGTLTLSNAGFFNELLQGITLGKFITFELSASTNAPASASLPDTFSFFILDPAATASLLTTTDPTGANSLFTLQIDGSPLGVLGNYSSTPAVSATLVPVTESVPEPDAFWLALFGIFAALLVRPVRSYTARQRLRSS